MRKIYVFVSQPMHGLPVDQIKEERAKILDAFKKFGVDNFWFEKEDEMVDINDTFDQPLPPFSGRLAFLGRSIMKMDDADFIIFADGWRMANGCRVEHKACQEYFGYNVEIMGRTYEMQYLESVNNEPVASTSPITPIDEIWFGRYKNE